MSYFDADFLEFFRELDQNNNKKWFDKNRKRYLKTIKDPFREFVQELILRLQKEDPALFTNPKESIFRINRDLRFTKDKTPYKVRVSAAMSTGGRKAADSPGYYIQLSHNNMMFGGGLYNPSKDGLYNIRTYIMEHPNELSQLVKDKAFKQTFSHLLGDKNKRMPAEFKEAAVHQPLMAHKQYYYMHESPEAHVLLESDFPDQVINNYKAGLGVNKFLIKALKS